MIITGLLNLIIMPILGLLNIVNIGVNFLLGIDWVVDVINVIAFVLPWENLFPLIGITVGIITFKITIALGKLIIDIIPLW